MASGEVLCRPAGARQLITMAWGNKSSFRRFPGFGGGRGPPRFEHGAAEKQDSEPGNEGGGGKAPAVPSDGGRHPFHMLSLLS